MIDNQNMMTPGQMTMDGQQVKPVAPGYGFDGTLEGAGRLIGAGMLVGLGGALIGGLIGGVASLFEDESKKKEMEADIVRQRKLQEEQLQLLTRDRVSAEARETEARRERARQEESAWRAKMDADSKALAVQKAALETEQKRQLEQRVEQMLIERGYKARQERVIDAEVVERPAPRKTAPTPAPGPQHVAVRQPDYQAIYNEELAAARLRIQARRAAERQAALELDSDEPIIDRQIESADDVAAAAFASANGKKPQSKGLIMPPKKS